MPTCNNKGKGAKNQEAEDVEEWRIPGRGVSSPSGVWGGPEVTALTDIRYVPIRRGIFPLINLETSLHLSSLEGLEWLIDNKQLA